MIILPFIYLLSLKVITGAPRFLVNQIYISITTGEEEHLFIYLLTICASSFVKCLCALIPFPSRSKLYSSPALCPQRITWTEDSRVLRLPFLVHPVGNHHQMLRVRKRETGGYRGSFCAGRLQGWLTLSTRGRNSCRAAL